MSKLDQFQKYAGVSNLPSTEGRTKAVIYTRVSTKEQADNNASLSTQMKYCEYYAHRKELTIVERFGGTHESAKTDSRKEFQRMLTYVKRRKDIAFIIVFSYDRFSRSGTSGASIKEDLKSRGIEILSATQEIDTTTPAGVMQQDVLFVFSKYDNDVRKDKCLTGMREKLRKGYIHGVTPFGYTNLNPGRNKDQQLVINEQGELLRKAFHMKAKQNLTYAEITKRLKKHGWTKNYKQLGAYFKNPIYCGIITSSLIPGEVIEGKHPPLISKELFLKVNAILDKKNFGGAYNRDDENLPLKQFVKAESCGTSYTGYHVKRKNLYYYKNNRQGSKENRSAKKMHDLFVHLLSQYQLADENLKEVFKDIIYEVFFEMHEESLSDVKSLSAQVSKIESKIEKMEERFVLGEIDKGLYTKYKGQFESELDGIQQEIENSGFNLSNLDLAIENALEDALNLPSLWASGDLSEKRRIQKMLFPEGILYNHEKHEYRTTRVNSLFTAISAVAGNVGVNKKGTNSNNMNLSHLVAGARLELTTFGL